MHAAQTYRPLPGGTQIMAIVNATPDSFSDGGRWSSMERLKRSVQAWVEAGVAWLDIGGESTRPGAKAVGAQEEWARVEPVIEALKDVPKGVGLSIDTRKACVARRALGLGVSMVNDVSGLADQEMAGVVAQFGAALTIGHLRGVPETMQRGIAFSQPTQEVGAELAAARSRALAAGVDPAKIWVDPGLGFGKSTEQCLELLVASHELQRITGSAVMIGASNKRFLGEICGREVQDRLSASVSAALIAAQNGASIVRVHEVLATRDALVLWERLQPGVAAAGSPARA